MIQSETRLLFQKCIYGNKKNIKSITRYNVFRLYINIEYRHKVKSRKICCDLLKGKFRENGKSVTS